jgi:preprotein translocase subunit SecF
LTALSLYLFGGPVLAGFSLALVVGIVAGTFSSVFIASPILLAWEERRAGQPHFRAAPEGNATGGAR